MRNYSVRLGSKFSLCVTQQTLKDCPGEEFGSPNLMYSRSLEKNRFFLTRVLQMSAKTLIEALSQRLL